MSALNAGVADRFSLRLPRPLMTLVLADAALLLISTSGLAGRVFAGVPGQLGVTPSFGLATLLTIATFVARSAIGWCCRTWRGVMLLPVCAWWLALVAHAAVLFVRTNGAATPYIGRVEEFEWNTSYRFDWQRGLLLAPSFGVLASLGWLGWLGWLARRALRDQR